MQAQPGDPALAGEGAVATDQLLQLAARAAEDQRQVRLAGRRQCQRQADIAQFAGEALGPVGLQQLHRRQVEGHPQGFAGRDRTGEAGGEVAGAVVAVTPGHVLQQRFGMDEPGVQGHAVEEGLEGGAGGTQGADHVDMAEAALVGDVDGTQVGAHRHGLVLHHQDGRRGALGQARAPAQQQVFQAALEGGVEGGADQRRAVGAVQPPSQQRRQAGLLARGEEHGLLQGFVHRPPGPDLELRQAPQHLVAGRLGPLRVAVRAQPAGGLGQHGEQRRLGAGQLGRRLAEVGPAGRRHTLQGAAERRTVEVEAEDFVLRQVPLQLRGAPELAQLAAEGARMRVEQPRHLHRQGAAAGEHSPAAQVEPGGAGQGQRVNTGVLVEPAVFISEQGFQVIGRDLVLAYRITPDAIGIGEAPERRAILRQHHPRQVIAGQWQREQAVGRPEQRHQQQGDGEPGAFEPSDVHGGPYLHGRLLPRISSGLRGWADRSPDEIRERPHSPAPATSAPAPPAQSAGRSPCRTKR
ncbi:hypothetical protein D3C78_389800 [compost metagenome]